MSALYTAARSLYRGVTLLAGPAVTMYLRRRLARGEFDAECRSSWPPAPQHRRAVWGWAALHTARGEGCLMWRSQVFGAAKWWRQLTASNRARV